MKKFLILFLFLCSCAGENSPNKIAVAEPAPILDMTPRTWVLHGIGGNYRSTTRTATLRQRCNVGLDGFRDETVNMNWPTENAIGGIGCADISNVEFSFVNTGTEPLEVKIMRDDVYLTPEEMGASGPVVLQPGQSFYFKFNL